MRRGGQKFFISDRFFIRVEALLQNQANFERVLGEYKNDLPFANAIRYALELVSEISAAIKSGDKIQAASAYKRYADHFNNVVLKMIRARNIHLFV
jgi:hypothetical protein